jgi:hypothetical protein
MKPKLPLLLMIASALVAARCSTTPCDPQPTAVSSLGHAAHAQNTVALMSDEVIRQRLATLCYEVVRIDKPHTLRYAVTVKKDGLTRVLAFHPQTSAMTELVNGKTIEPWLMPLEPKTTKPCGQ